MMEIHKKSHKMFIIIITIIIIIIPTNAQISSVIFIRHYCDIFRC